MKEMRVFDALRFNTEADSYRVYMQFNYEYTSQMGEDPLDSNNANRPGIDMLLSIETETDHANRHSGKDRSYEMTIFRIYNTHYDDFCDFLGVPRLKAPNIRGRRSTSIRALRTSAEKSPTLQKAENYLSRFK